MTAPGLRAAGAALSPPPSPQSATRARSRRNPGGLRAAALLLLFAFSLLAGLAPDKAQAQTAQTGTLSGDTFTTGDFFGAVSVSNVPGGLTGRVARNSSTMLTLTLTGTADSHAASDSITNLTITVGDDAYTNSNAADVENSTKNNIAVTFIDAAPNRAPEFTDGATTTRSFAENTAAGQNIGTPVGATDADSGDTLSYTLGGTDANDFTIVSTTGQLQTKTGETYNFEAKSSYTVTVTVADGNGGTDNITVTINVTDRNETPGNPGAPTLSSATGGSLTVQWTPSTNTGPAVTYDVEYREGTSGSWSDGPQDVTGTSATIANLMASTGYQVRVQADNGEGTSGWVQSASTLNTSAPTASISWSGGQAGFVETSDNDGTVTGTAAAFVTGDTLTPDREDGESGTRTEADMDLAMAAVGARAVVVEPGAEGGLELAVKPDAMAVRTTSERVETAAGVMEATDTDVTRLRLGVEGTWHGAGNLVPTAEVALRHDGGDAETGLGVEVGGGLAFSDPSSGLKAALTGRALVAHADDDYREWGVGGSLVLDPGAQGRGLSFALRPAWGAEASAAERLLSGDPLTGLAANDDGDEAQGRLDAELGYGLPAFGGLFTGTPHAGFTLGGTARELRLGWRLAPATGKGLDFDLGLEATRREAANDDGEAEHGIELELNARF